MSRGSWRFFSACSEVEIERAKSLNAAQPKVCTGACETSAGRH